MGTVPYMSPEQVSGLAVDHRTDIFSWGSCFTRWRRGPGPSRAARGGLLSAILRDPPPSLEASRSDLPDGLRHVISCCLQKKPDDRYPTARETRSGPAGPA